MCPWEMRCLPEEVLVSLGARALTRRWGSQYQSLVPLAQGLLPSILQALESELVLGPSSWWVCSTDTCVSHGEGVLGAGGVGFGRAELLGFSAPPQETALCLGRATVGPCQPPPRYLGSRQNITVL